jgi:hypothetical protein
MLEQQYAEPSPADGDPPADRAPAGSTLPNWQVVARRTIGTVCDRILGECWAPTWQRGLLVLGVIVGLLVVIAVTLSVGNALLVGAVGAVMRILCEYRR